MTADPSTCTNPLKEKGITPMQFNRKKIAAATVMSAVAASAVVGGTLASFTDSATTAPQVLKAGTVDVNLVPGADWNTTLDNLAIGDTATRVVAMNNVGTLAVKTLHLSAKVADTPGAMGGNLSEATTVDIIENAGTTPNTLATGVPLSSIASTAGYNLTVAAASGSTENLSFVYHVVGAPAAATGSRTAGARDDKTNPDNAYQGSSMSVTYTIDAIQRDGIAQ